MGHEEEPRPRPQQKHFWEQDPETENTCVHVQVKAIPEMLSILDPLFKQSMDEMPQLYEDCKPGSVKYRNDNEPHLVKYTGDVHKGVCMHTDSAEITLNIALSDPDDFEGGGTYFECLDEVSEICKISYHGASSILTSRLCKCNRL